MKHKLHIIATCADRKREPPSRERCLGSHTGRQLKARLESFVSALKRNDDDGLVIAGDLYVGPYWAKVRDLPAVASSVGLNATLWVASAGYGLIPAESTVRSYSATFRVGAPDSVARKALPEPIRDQLRAWWEGLASWSGPARGLARRVRDLAAEEARATILIVASPSYVQAMAYDLAATAAQLRDRLLIVTSYSVGEEHPLARNIIPSQAPLKSLIGGALPALHARVAHHIICESKEHGLSAGYLRTRYRSLIDSADCESAPERTPITDAEVRHLVWEFLKKEGDLDCTPALRRLRDDGFACEQKRFKRLFHEVRLDHVN